MRITLTVKICGALGLMAAAQLAVGLLAIRAASDGAQTAIIIALVISLLGALVLARWLFVNTVPRLRRCVVVTGMIGDGDLTARIRATRNDEIGDLAHNLNAMSESLGEITGQLVEHAQAVGTSATEILATVTSQTAGANQRSAAINETTTATEEIRASAEQALLKADEVSERAGTAVQAAEEGAQAVDAIVEGMSEIEAKVEAIAADVQELSEQSAQIADITGAVNDLADQSNVLALNAKIEAARRRAGKGLRGRR